jgi:hypothetical protein
LPVFGSCTWSREPRNPIKSSQVKFSRKLPLKEMLLAGVRFDSLHLNSACDKASEKRTNTQTYRETHRELLVESIQRAAHRELLVESIQRAAWRMEITMNDYASDPQQVVGTVFYLNPKP